MEPAANIVTLWPRCMDSAGEMLWMKALARIRCCKCGALLQAELEDIVARHGPDHSLIDRLERCRMVECEGSTFYLASRTYRREWVTLLRDRRLMKVFEELPPVRTARR